MLHFGFGWQVRYKIRFHLIWLESHQVIRMLLFLAAKKRKAMSFDGFQKYLCSLEGSIFKPEFRKLHQDMGQPLSHYFISSSHNTYLLEDQLRGQSSQEAYIQWEVQQTHCSFVQLEESSGEKHILNPILKNWPICDKMASILCVCFSTSGSWPKSESCCCF